MLKKTITYTDFDGNKVTEDYFFNLSKTELIEMQMEIPGGMQAMLEDLIKSEDNSRIIATFKDLILRAYGVKSADGKRFIKSKELSEEFTQTEAYSELFVELLSDPDKATAFLTGILPTLTPEQQAMVDEEVKKQLAAHPELDGTISFSVTDSQDKAQ